MLGTRIAAEELNWPFLVPELTACPPLHKAALGQMAPEPLFMPLV